MVNVDIVYKTVLYILNKEQRGYLTPDEFSKLGIQVQREIFEKYFEDLNQQLRVPQTDVEYADRVENLEEKIDVFKTSALCSPISANTFNFPTDPVMHKLGTLVYEYPNNHKEIQPMNQNEYLLVNRSPLTRPTKEYPVYVSEGIMSPSAPPSKFTAYPDSIQSRVRAYYVKAPDDPRWGYSVGSLGQYIYDSTVYGANLLNNGGTLTNFTTPLVGGIVGSYAAPTFTTTNATPGSFAISAEVTSAATVVITITNPGSGFVVGDTITVDNDQLGIGSTGPVIELTAADFNSGSTYGSTQFEVHPTEQTNLVLNILMYTGVIIRDPNVVQTATALVQQDEVNQKS